MKTAVIIDLPDDIDVNDVFAEVQIFPKPEATMGCKVFWEKYVGFKLKPLPKKVEVDKEIYIDYNAMEKGWQCGWNACLEEITGEKE